jgi:hypothetical protein
MDILRGFKNNIVFKIKIYIIQGNRLIWNPILSFLGKK